MNMTVKLEKINGKWNMTIFDDTNVQFINVIYASKQLAVKNVCKIKKAYNMKVEYLTNKK